jgi:glycosyltransferase involved in cell wall biosynthesis
LAMIVKNEQAVIGRCLQSAKGLVDRYVIVDTGSTDNTASEAEKTMEGTEGEIISRPWQGFADARTAALEAAKDLCDWTLTVDADHTVEHDPDLAAWLGTDPDPTVDAWNVQISDHGTTYRLPLLVRGGIDWAYEGATHEYLATNRKSRSLLGLTLVHHGDGGNQQGKLERHIELLADGVAANDPRSVFYTAECFRYLGRTQEAIVMYGRRAEMGGFEEERWYASYQVAALAGDIEGLLAAHRARPWRHEPLTAAGRIIASQPNDDLLFLESL